MIIKKQKFPAIFIIGLPRSGTTFLHQLICKNYDVGYINNLIARFYDKPKIGINLSKKFKLYNLRKDIILKSHYGRSIGIEGPHEFGYFWNNFFRFKKSSSHNLSLNELKKLNNKLLKKKLLEILNSYNGPFIFKNLTCGFQASFLSKIIKCVFIKINRDKKNVCKSMNSLYFQNEKINKKKILSLRPSNFSRIFNKNIPLKKKIKMQIDFCKKDLENEIKSDQNIKIIDISYEDLVLDKKVELKKIERFYKDETNKTLIRK